MLVVRRRPAPRRGLCGEKQRTNPKLNTQIIQRHLEGGRPIAARSAPLNNRPWYAAARSVVDTSMAAKQHHCFLPYRFLSSALVHTSGFLFGMSVCHERARRVRLGWLEGPSKGTPPLAPNAPFRNTPYTSWCSRSWPSSPAACGHLRSSSSSPPGGRRAASSSHREKWRPSSST